MITIEGYPVEPCPFCGSEDLEVWNTAYSKNPLLFHYVHCKECQADGPPDLGTSGAVDVWNTRAIAVKKK